MDGSCAEAVKLLASRGAAGSGGGVEFQPRREGEVGGGGEKLRGISDSAAAVAVEAGLLHSWPTGTGEEDTIAPH